MMLLFVSAALAGACPDLGASINGISAALNDVDLDSARSISLEATAGLACQPAPINPVVLTSLFQLAGAVELFMGEPVAADVLFERAASVSPLATIDPVLGDDAAAAYDAVRKQVMDTPGGTLRVEGQVEAWLDGRPIAPGGDVDVAVGNHLLQWREAPDAPLQARVVRVATREGRVLPLGAQTAAAATPAAGGTGGASASGSSGSGARMGALAGGAVGVIAGGVLIGVAGLSHSAFDRETDPTELGRLQTRTNALTIAGLGVGAVGLAVGGVGVVLLDGGGGLSWSHRW